MFEMSKFVSLNKSDDCIYPAVCSVILCLFVSSHCRTRVTEPQCHNDTRFGPVQWQWKLVQIRVHNY